MAFLRRAIDPTKTFCYWLDAMSPDPEKPMHIDLRYIGSGNAAWKNAMAKLPSGLRGQALAEMLAEAFAEHAIADWGNFVENGLPVAFSVEAAKRFTAELVQPPPVGDPDAFDRMFAAASNANNYRAPIAGAGPLGSG